MSKRKNILSLILSVLVAIVLLVSGYAKAADAAYFSNIVWSTFHNEWMALSAAGWILLEVLLGCLLLLQWRQRLVAVITAVALVGASCVYVFGATQLGMTSCGCFGHLDVLDLGLVGTLIRNAVLLGVLIYVAIRPSASVTRFASMAYVLLIGTVIAAFMTGYTMRGATVLFARSQDTQGQLVEDSPLQQLGLSADSSYLVFAFSFNCPYCQMAVGNVSLYEQSGLVDRVVGIALTDSVAEKRFLACYQGAPFRYRTVSWNDMKDWVKDLPTAYLIQHDTIRYAWIGEVPPAIFYKQ